MHWLRAQFGNGASPCSLTGPSRTVEKIGGALFPSLALPIRQFVTLRLSKAPITECESASDRRLPLGKRFLGRSQQTACQSFGSVGEWIYRFETDSGRACQAWLKPSPTCRLSGSSRRSGCVPAEPYPPLEHYELKPRKHTSQMMKNKLTN